MKSKPQIRVNNIKTGSKTDSQSIQIFWNGIDASPENGGEPVDYIVYWAKNDGSPWRMLTYSTNQATSIETKMFTDEKLSDHQYKFMVQAFNFFGQGPNSTVHYAQKDLTSKMGMGATFSATLTALISLCS